MNKTSPSSGKNSSPGKPKRPPPLTVELRVTEMQLASLKTLLVAHLPRIGVFVDPERLRPASFVPIRPIPEAKRMYALFNDVTDLLTDIRKMRRLSRAMKTGKGVLPEGVCDVHQNQ